MQPVPLRSMKSTKSIKLVSVKSTRAASKSFATRGIAYLSTSSRVASPRSSRGSFAWMSAAFVSKAWINCSKSFRDSSTRNWFFSNMLSLMTPVNKAIMPKLPMITKPTRNNAKNGLLSRRPSSSMKVGRFGEDINTKSVIMEVDMSPKRRWRNLWCGSLSGSRPHVRTMTMEHTYSTTVIRIVTQKTACTASINPKASKYSCFRNLMMRNSRMIRRSRMILKRVATPPPDKLRTRPMSMSAHPMVTTMKSKMFQDTSGFLHQKKYS
mmetsp:Transcript_7384/g.20944  ORF Transcript_7384/g.20944 Transcript_7384/m.20944 type:complete len:267 (+) Transcript_7384:1162-1962(+)